MAWCKHVSLFFLFCFLLSSPSLPPSSVSILGMHLFGCKFGSEREEDTVPDRKNFDSLLWAIVTVFQVSTNPFSSIFTFDQPRYGQFGCSFTL